MVTPSVGMLHHEDLPLGRIGPLGAKHVNAEEIVAFARRFDPQAIHLDDQYARKSIVAGLCASGLHTCCIMMRLLCDEILLQAASLGSPGLDEVKWLKPLRPGDVVSLIAEVFDKRELASRPGVGLSDIMFGLVDAKGELVLTTRGKQLMRLRQPPQGSTVTNREKRTARRPIGSVDHDLWSAEPIRQALAVPNYFEDVVIGEVIEVGSHSFARDEITEFAADFDPQAFHLDEAAAAKSLFGGLSASGWHTASMLTRKVVDFRLDWWRKLESVGLPVAQWGPSPGFCGLYWLKPVLVGDNVTFRTKVIEKEDSRSRLDRGLLSILAEGRNQRGEVVIRVTERVLVERRGKLELP